MLDPPAVHRKVVNHRPNHLSQADNCLIVQGGHLPHISQNRQHARADHPTKKAPPGGHSGAGESGDAKDAPAGTAL
jgi:hypothetical protein